MLELFYELLLGGLEDDLTLLHNCLPAGNKFQKLYKLFSNCMFCCGFWGKQSHFDFTDCLTVFEDLSQFVPQKGQVLKFLVKKSYFYNYHLLSLLPIHFFP